MYTYNAKVVGVIDGDTYDLDIDLGFHIHIHERVRVLDVDTPETRGEEAPTGKAVASFVRDMLLGRDVVIRSEREVLPRTDSFGRWLVSVWLDGRSVADILTASGLNKLDKGYTGQLKLDVSREDG